MNNKNRRIIGTVALTLGLAVLYFILTLTALHRVGTDAELYHREQTRAGILPAAGISDEALRALDGRLADYLRGDAAALETDPPFNGREMTHLRDCFDLFALLRKVRARLIPWAVLLIAGGAWLLQDKRRVRLCAWLSPLLLLIPLGLFALFAALHFDRAFTLFHRVLFRNDLWQLDPKTDLLIRICPESMFARMGARIGAYSLAAILAVSALATALTFIWPKKKGENTWKTTTRRGPAPKRIDFGRRGTR
jgi:integral membrane protein (TIGR01906 family)